MSGNNLEKVPELFESLRRFGQNKGTDEPDVTADLVPLLHQYTPDFLFPCEVPKQTKSHAWGQGIETRDLPYLLSRHRPG